MYLYQSHMGGVYTSSKLHTYDELYCDQCGDSDDYIGEVNSPQDIFDYLYDPYDENYDEDDDRGFYNLYGLDYVEEVIEENFGVDNYVVIEAHYDDLIFVNYTHDGMKLPMKPLHDIAYRDGLAEYLDSEVRNFVFWDNQENFNEYKFEMKFDRKEVHNNKTYYIYTMTVDSNLSIKRDISSFTGDNTWQGFTSEIDKIIGM